MSRRQLRDAGVNRHDVRNAVAAGRWHLVGQETVLVVGSPPLIGEARSWWAVLEAGAEAVLDGVSALHAAGLTGFTSDVIDVTLPRGTVRPSLDNVTIHQPRETGRVLTAGLPRTAPEVAALRAAAWAVSDRQAALILAMCVQQRLVSAERLLSQWATLKRSRRRALIETVVNDLADGAHSLGELDFAAMCRQRGLPEPTRQAVRHGAAGRVYLDVAWEDIGLVVEIDGSHHGRVDQSLADAFRQNEVTIAGERVLRIPLIALRVRADEFMDQVERAHRLLRGASTA